MICSRIIKSELHTFFSVISREPPVFKFYLGPQLRTNLFLHKHNQIYQLNKINISNTSDDNHLKTVFYGPTAPTPSPYRQCARLAEASPSLCPFISEARLLNTWLQPVCAEYESNKARTTCRPLLGRALDRLPAPRENGKHRRRRSRWGWWWTQTWVHVAGRWCGGKKHVHKQLSVVNKTHALYAADVRTMQSRTCRSRARLK